MCKPDYDLEKYTLDDGIRLIVQASERLKYNVKTRCSAMLIYHQFVKRSGDMKYDPKLLAAACLSLSVKLLTREDKLDDVLQTCFWIIEDYIRPTTDERFIQLKNSLIKMEHIVLRMMQFNLLSQRLAHDYLVYFLFDVREELVECQIWHEIFELSLKITTDFYHFKTCLKYEAEELATSAIYAAFYLAGVDLEIRPHMKVWLEQLSNASKTEELLKHIYENCCITPVAEKKCRT